jgi:hypothetical protein
MYLGTTPAIGLPKEVEAEIELEKKKKVPSVTEKLPYAFRKSRKLYPNEIAYVKEIYGDSIRYDKVRITRDHWFSAGSTRVVGNTINFASNWGSTYLFEDTPEWKLNKAGLDLLGHEIGHVWQFQNGGWAYAGDALIKQAAGYYSTGSRNTAYDFETAIYWDIPWEKWGPEQQAEAIDQWNLATRNTHDKKQIRKLQPYVEKARRGEGAVQISVGGTIVCCLIAGGIGYIASSNKKKGVAIGTAIGVLVNLPWNKWFLKKHQS